LPSEQSQSINTSGGSDGTVHHSLIDSAPGGFATPTTRLQADFTDFACQKKRTAAAKKRTEPSLEEFDAEDSTARRLSFDEETPFSPDEQPPPTPNESSRSLFAGCDDHQQLKAPPLKEVSKERKKKEKSPHIPARDAKQVKNNKHSRRAKEAEEMRLLDSIAHPVEGDASSEQALQIKCCCAVCVGTQPDPELTSDLAFLYDEAKDASHPPDVPFAREWADAMLVKSLRRDIAKLSGEEQLQRVATAIQALRQEQRPRAGSGTAPIPYRQLLLLEWRCRLHIELFLASARRRADSTGSKPEDLKRGHDKEHGDDLLSMEFLFHRGDDEDAQNELHLRLCFHTAAKTISALRITISAYEGHTDGAIETIFLQLLRHRELSRLLLGRFGPANEADPSFTETKNDVWIGIVSWVTRRTPLISFPILDDSMLTMPRASYLSQFRRVMDALLELAILVQSNSPGLISAALLFSMARKLFEDIGFQSRMFESSFALHRQTICHELDMSGGAGKGGPGRGAQRSASEQQALRDFLKLQASDRALPFVTERVLQAFVQSEQLITGADLSALKVEDLFAEPAAATRKIKQSITAFLRSQPKMMKQPATS
jgi:hypothetical protein